jgi:transposase
MRLRINEKHFEGQTIYVGIDVHKKNWKVSMYCGGIEHKSISMDPSPEVLSAYLKRTFPGAGYQAVYEAGFSGFSACRSLLSLGVDCKVIHASDVPTTQKQKLQKTDTVDSRKLAQSLTDSRVNFIHIPTASLEADRSLLRQRSRLVEDITRTKLRVKSLLFQHGIAIPDWLSEHQTRYWSGAFTQWLTELEPPFPSLSDTIARYVRIGLFQRKELLMVNRQIRQLAATGPYQSLYQTLLSVPGIGCTTAMWLLVQLGDITRFASIDQLNSYIGLVPSMHGSGDRMSTGPLIKRGHKKLKSLLIEAAWIAVKRDPALMSTFLELSKRMPKNKAIIRIARKLINRIKYILTHHQPYETGIIN